MDVQPVRMWRPGNQEGLLLLAGRTEHYAVDPRGEYVFGVVLGAPMRSRRGSERRVIAPGELVAWDPSRAHLGASVDRRPWAARLMIVESATYDALSSDEELEIPAGSSFPEPVCADPALAREFMRRHAALDAPTTRLERDVRLTSWLATVTARHATRPRQPGRPRRDHDDRALRLARDHLDEHARAAGVGKFRLVRLFRARTGLAPHALQLAHRVRAARRLLESGHSIADTATITGFADQSHLHRHFQRTFGMTPGQYQSHITRHRATVRVHAPHRRLASAAPRRQ